MATDIFTVVGNYYIRNFHSGLYLGVDAEGFVIQTQEQNAKVWELAKDSGDSSILQFYIPGTKDVLDVQKSGGQRSHVIQYPNYLTSNQKWKYCQENKYLIPQHQPDMVLDDPDWEKGVTKLIIWPANGGANQKWVLEPIAAC